jgi:hypothetical protein
MARDWAGIAFVTWSDLYKRDSTPANNVEGYTDADARIALGLDEAASVGQCVPPRVVRGN